MDTIFYLFNVNLHFIAMQTSGANAITLHIVQKEQCTPNVFSATHSTLLVVAPPLEDTAYQSTQTYTNPAPAQAAHTPAVVPTPALHVTIDH